MIVCVAANPSVDKLFEVERLLPGEIHRPSGFVQVPGGKGLNVARAIAQLGGHALATGLLAGHVGRWVQDALVHEGVEARFAWTAGETRSSLSVADRETGRLTEFYEAGHPIAPEEWSALVELVQAVLPEASWLAISGSLPPGLPEDGYAELARRAAAAGVPAAVDSRGPALARALEASPALVKINLEEATDLLEVSLASAAEALAAAREIRRRAGGAGHATVVTMGAEGTVMVDPAGGEWAGRPSGRGRYPVGSGDVFLGALLTGLDRGESWSGALRLALGASAANAQAPGAARLHPDEAAVQAAGAELEALGNEH